MPAELSTRLRALLVSLREDLKPELTTPNAKLRAQIMDLTLTRLAVEAQSGAAGAESALDSVAAPAAPAQMGAAARAKLVANIAHFARTESAQRAALETEIAALATQRPEGKRSAGELLIPKERFTAYLRKRFPNDPDIEVLQIAVVPGGRSKGTILVDVKGRSTPASFVLRRDFELSVTGTSVSYEYPALKAAYDAGFPAPPPLWLEEDPGAIGGPFIAFERVLGKPMGTLFSSDAPPAFVREFAAVLGKLHALDIDAIGIGNHLRFGQSPQPVRAMLESFQDRYRAGTPQTPLMDAAFTWLWLKLDSIGNERRLVHGDAGLHNTMGEGEKVTALLDWEFCHAGDPAEDLTYCKYLVQRILPWGDFMAVYLANGGRPVSQERMDFFTVWRTLHLSILTGMARKLFQSGADVDLRLATIGYDTFPKQLRDLAADLASVT